MFIKILIQLSATVVQRPSHCLAHSSPRFVSGRVDIFNFSMGLELGEMVGQNLNHYWAEEKEVNLDVFGCRK